MVFKWLWAIVITLNYFDDIFWGFWPIIASIYRKGEVSKYCDQCNIEGKIQDSVVFTECEKFAIERQIIFGYHIPSFVSLDQVTDKQLSTFINETDYVSPVPTTGW